MGEPKGRRTGRGSLEINTLPFCCPVCLPVGNSLNRTHPFVQWRSSPKDKEGLVDFHCSFVPDLDQIPLRKFSFPGTGGQLNNSPSTH